MASEVVRAGARCLDEAEDRFSRGICVMNETVREWEKKSARRSPIRSDSARLFAATNGIWMGWVISIAGEPYWLWRAVDQNGFVLDVLVQRRRDSRAAQQLMRKLLKSASHRRAS
jgi:putative transposase